MYLSVVFLTTRKNFRKKRVQSRQIVCFSLFSLYSISTFNFMLINLRNELIVYDFNLKPLSLSRFLKRFLKPPSGNLTTIQKVIIHDYNKYDSSLDPCSSDKSFHSYKHTFLFYFVVVKHYKYKFLYTLIACLFIITDIFHSYHKYWVCFCISVVVYILVLDRAIHFRSRFLSQIRNEWIVLQWFKPDFRLTDNIEAFRIAVQSRRYCNGHSLL